MKKVLAWLKGHWLIVVFGVIAIAALPALWFVSSGMNASVREAVDTDVKRQLRDLGAIKVGYELEPLLPDGQRFEASIPPNEATSARMAELLERSAAQVGAVRSAVVEFNSAGKGPLVERLFPEPASALTRQERLYAMAREWVSFNRGLAARYGGGLPSPADEVEFTLRQVKEREEQALGGAPGAELNEEDRATVERTLRSERLRLYEARAQQLRFYAAPDVIAGVDSWSGATAPPIEQAWDWQWRTWVHEDVMRAVTLANSGASSVLGAPVKRLEQVRVEPMAFTGQGQQAGAFEPTQAVQPDFSRGFTGRAGWPDRPNPLYDVRMVDVQAIVRGEAIPQIIDAFASTNLMTVVDLDIEHVPNLFDQLREGFLYTNAPTGEDLVRVRMRIETVWLREWTSALMPAPVRAALGVPDPAPAEGEAPAGGEEEMQ